MVTLLELHIFIQKETNIFETKCTDLVPNCIIESKHLGNLFGTKGNKMSIRLRNCAQLEYYKFETCFANFSKPAKKRAVPPQTKHVLSLPKKLCMCPNNIGT